MATDDAVQTGTKSLSSLTRRPLVALSLVALCLAGAYAFGDALLAGAPSPKNPGFVDSLLASSAVLAAVRLAIIAAAAYVVTSVAALMGRRQWLTRVGPVEVSARVLDLKAENTTLEEMLTSAEARIEDLDERLATTEDALDTAFDSIDENGNTND
jgi:hypothetical protein